MVQMFFESMQSFRSVFWIMFASEVLVCGQYGCFHLMPLLLLEGVFSQ